MNRFLFAVFIMSLLTISLAGCENKDITGSAPPDTVQSEVDDGTEVMKPVETTFQGMDATFEAEYSIIMSDLGKTALALMEYYDMAEYIWYSEKAEIFTIDRAVYFFSGPIMDASSVCIAVLFSNHTAWTIHDFQAFFTLVYQSSPEFIYPYYEGCTSQYLMRFFVDEEGKALLDGHSNIYLQAVNTVLTDSSLAGLHEWQESQDGETLQPASLRDQDDWKLINSIAKDLGVSYDQLKTSYESVSKADPEFEELFDSTGFVDLNSGIQYFADTEDRCRYIVIPIQLVLPDESLELSASTIPALFNAPFSYTQYHSVGYVFAFEDMRIHIPCDKSGIVDKNGHMILISP